MDKQAELLKKNYNERMRKEKLEIKKKQWKVKHQKEIATILDPVDFDPEK